MYSPAMIVAQSKINELQAEAAANRLAKKNRSDRRDSRGRLAVAMSNVRSFLSARRQPVFRSSPTTPTGADSLQLRPFPPSHGRARRKAGAFVFRVGRGASVERRSAGVSTSRSVSPAGSSPRHSASAIRRVLSVREQRLEAPLVLAEQLARGLGRGAVADRGRQRADLAAAGRGRQRRPSPPSRRVPGPGR